MSSNIISRNHVAQMLKSYKKEVSLGDVQTVSVAWSPPACPIDAILFSPILFKAGYVFKKRSVYKGVFSLSASKLYDWQVIVLNRISASELLH